MGGTPQWTPNGRTPTSVEREVEVSVDPYPPSASSTTISLVEMWR